MPDYVTIHNPSFDRTVTLRDAYRVMERFVENYSDFDRGEKEMVSFIAYSFLDREGIGGDSKALPDYLKAVAQVLGPPPTE